MAQGAQANFSDVMSRISTSRPTHAGLYFQILAQLDLKRDAANLYREDVVRSSRLSKSKREELHRAYLQTPNRIYAQILPLRVDTVSDLKRLLARGIPPLNDPFGKVLLTRLLGALEEEEPDYEVGQSRDVTSLVARIEDLREHLWWPDSPPPLELWDCPALLSGTATHARATQRKDRHIIALSFDASDEEFLIQALHEDTHPLTDPPIRLSFTGISQDTRTGTSGFELHRALETAVVERNQELFEQHARDLLEPYARWRERMNMPK